MTDVLRVHFSLKWSKKENVSTGTEPVRRITADATMTLKTLNDKYGVLLKTDGSRANLKPRNGRYWKVEELQHLVGGTFDLIKLKTSFFSLSDDYYLVINDNGKLEGLPMNFEPSNLYRRYVEDDLIVGDALVSPAKFIR